MRVYSIDSSSPSGGFGSFGGLKSGKSFLKAIFAVSSCSLAAIAGGFPRISVDCLLLICNSIKFSLYFIIRDQAIVMAIDCLRYRMAAGSSFVAGFCETRTSHSMVNARSDSFQHILKCLRVFSEIMQLPYHFVTSPNFSGSPYIWANSATLCKCSLTVG